MKRRGPQGRGSVEDLAEMAKAFRKLSLVRAPAPRDHEGQTPSRDAAEIACASSKEGATHNLTIRDLGVAGSKGWNFERSHHDIPVPGTTSFVIIR
ncbi:MAG: hypothetical protein JRN15_11685 [Nitrososphaerota archaeon]|nr:hypothetical protein [Nitrososphaerota archaeon]